MFSEQRRLERISVALFSLVVAMILLLPAWGQAAYAEDTSGDSVVYYDGTYEGSGQGYNGEVTVAVTITGGEITKISEVSQKETASYWERAKALFDTIIAEQGTEVEGISGATKSSDGIKEAVNDALAKAIVDPEGWYASGNGSARKPYIIETPEQLAKFAVAVDEGDTLAGKYVALGADIDLSGIDNWNPIGTEGKTDSAKKFAGTFDGQGHTINGLKISGEYTDETNVGLFASVDKEAVIKKLHMTDVTVAITGSNVLRAGGIAGDTVNGTTEAGTWVDRCSVEGKVSADSSGQALVFASGIIGRGMAWTKISNSWADVDASAISRGGSHSGYAGGMFGMSGNNTLITNCASFGEAYGCSPKSTNFGGMAGGLGGMLTSKAYNVYAMGNVTIGNGGTKHTWVGALAGEFPSGGMVKQPDGSYLYPDTGAFRDFGYYADDISLKIEKWSGAEATTEETELRATGTSSSMSSLDKVFETKTTAMPRKDMASKDFVDTLNANLKETRKLMDAYGYADIELYNWATTDSGVLPVGDKWVNKDPDVSVFAGGAGTQEDPYQIETEGQLRAFAGSLTEGIDYDGMFVKVTKDIDISSADWTPIGGQDYAFNGTFDGDGHAISGMHAGSKDAPYAMGAENPYMGFFGVLGKAAVIKDVHLTDVDIYASTPQYVYLGGIAAINDADSSTRQAMMIDGCSVTGKMTGVADKSNAFVGGIIASQYRGAVINCWTDLDLKCTVKTGNAIAEVGGLVALNNRGLVANGYTLGDVYGSASRTGGDEGMASTGNLVGVQAGDLVGCYSKGDNTTAEYSVYAGALSGWITGIGKVYSCYYNKEAKMVIDGREVNPPADFGTKVAPGVNEEGDAYVGGIVDELVAYTAADYKEIADKLNAKFGEYSIDLSLYGVRGAALRQWTYDNEARCVVLKDTKSETTYKQPQAEIVPPEVEELRDGTFYGRDPEKKLTVRITVKDHEIVGEPKVVSGDASDQGVYEAALSRATSKALYGDTTGYGTADGKLFNGGKGTKKDPYLISNEKQLRAIAEALNEDETFADVWFKQTSDIDVASKDWLPIGFGIMAKVNKAWTQVAAYPFLGNYDGDGHRITGLTIGNAKKPSEDPRVNYTAGLFGFVSGDHYSNEKITEDVRICRLLNIKLRNVDIHVSGEGQNYTGTLVGNAQNGFLIDNCSATGKVSSYSKDRIARGAGIAGNVIRGTVLNTWSDVAALAETDAGNAYVGGLYAIDNRVTSINCYSLGDVTGNAAANNKVHIGGLSGQAGGVHYNCYAAGDVTSLKTTSDAGLVEGRLAGIAVDSKVYYCSDATLTVAGTAKEPQAVGVSVPDNFDIQPKTSAEISSQDFVDLLNKNVQAATQNVDSLQEIINAQTDLTHTVQFSGDANSLAKWILDERAVLVDKNIAAGQEQAYQELEKLRDSVEIDDALKEVAGRLYEEARNSIGNATDKKGISQALDQAKAAFDQLQAQSDKLKLVKELARNEILDHKVSDYSGDRLDQLLDVLLDAQAKIDKAKTPAETEKIIKDAKAAVARIKTDKMIAAEKKAGASKKATVSKATYTKAVQSAKARKVTSFKVKAQKKKKAKVSWKKATGASGYEIYRATKKNGKFSKVATVGQAKDPQYINKRLKAKKKYFYKMRPYTVVITVEGNRNMVYGKWSPVRKIKAKK